MKGTEQGTGLLNQQNFDHNVKEIKNVYEEYLLSCGQFDERMFLNDFVVVKGTGSLPSSPRSEKCTSFATTIGSGHLIKCNLSQVAYTRI